MVEDSFDENMEDVKGVTRLWSDTARFLRPHVNVLVESTAPRERAEESWTAAFKLAKLLYYSHSRRADTSDKIALAQRHLWVTSNADLDTEWREAAADWLSGENPLKRLRELVVAELRPRLPQDADRVRPRREGPRPDPATRRRVVKELERILEASVTKSFERWIKHGAPAPRADVDYDVLVRHHLCKHAWGQFLAASLVTPMVWYDAEERTASPRLDHDARRRLIALDIPDSGYFVLRAAGACLWSEFVDMRDQAAQLRTAVQVASDPVDDWQAEPETPLIDSLKEMARLDADPHAFFRDPTQEKVVSPELDQVREEERLATERRQQAALNEIRDDVHHFRDSLIEFSEATIDGIANRRYQNLLRCIREDPAEQEEALAELEPPETGIKTQSARSRARTQYLRGMAQRGVVRVTTELAAGQRLGSTHILTHAVTERYANLEPQIHQLEQAQSQLAATIELFSSGSAGVQELDDALRAVYDLRRVLRAELHRRGALTFFEKRLVDLPGNLPRSLHRLEGQGQKGNKAVTTPVAIEDHAAEKGLVIVVPPGVDNVRELDEELLAKSTDPRATLMRALLKEDKPEGKWYWFPEVTLNV